MKERSPALPIHPPNSNRAQNLLPTRLGCLALPILSIHLTGRSPPPPVHTSQRKGAKPLLSIHLRGRNSYPHISKQGNSAFPMHPSQKKGSQHFLRAHFKERNPSPSYQRILNLHQRRVKSSHLVSRLCTLVGLRIGSGFGVLATEETLPPFLGGPDRSEGFDRRRGQDVGAPGVCGLPGGRQTDEMSAWGEMSHHSRVGEVVTC